MTITWCTVPEIWNVTDTTFCHFGLLFALYPPPSSPPPSNNQKSQNFGKINKGPGDITILHMSTINGNRMIYGSRDIKHDRQMSQMWQMSFWIIFCPFTPLTTQKIKILKKWKKHYEIHHFYTSVPKIMIICHAVP